MKHVPLTCLLIGFMAPLAKADSLSDQIERTVDRGVRALRALHEKGGGAARYWAGLYGAGQPVVKVRGLVYDGDKLVFVSEARRSGCQLNRCAGSGSPLAVLP